MNGSFLAGGAFFVLVPVLFLGFLGLMIFVGIKGYQAAQRRRAAIDAMVLANGWRRVPEDPQRVELFVSSPFQTGDNRRARDIVWGTVNGRPFETFAYSYETHTTDSKGHRSTTTHHFQVTWVPLPGPMATMRLTGDNPLLRALSHMGMRDLDVESHEFNQRWKVWCDDERSGHAVLTPRMIERLMQSDLSGRAVVFEGALLFSYAPGISDLGELPMVVRALNEIADLVPRFLFESDDTAPPGDRPNP